MSLNTQRETRLVKLIADQLGIKEEEVKPNSHFVDDLGADSLDLIEMLMTTEEEFEVEIPDEDAEPLMSVETVLKYLESQYA